MIPSNLIEATFQQVSKHFNTLNATYLTSELKMYCVCTANMNNTKVHFKKSQFPFSLSQSVYVDVAPIISECKQNKPMHIGM